MNKQPLLLTIILAGSFFCPTAATETNRPSRIDPDVVYGHKDGLAMTMDVYRPESKANAAAVLFVVSSGWYSRWSPPEHAKSRFQPYLDQGYTMMAVRHGSSPRYSIAEAVSDLRRAVRFARKNAKRFGIDAERLGVMGMSAGGHLALMLGTTGDDGVPGAKDALRRVSSRVAAVVALVPPTDLRVMVWQASETLPVYRNFPALNLPLKEAGQNSPLLHVTEDDAPSLVIIGGRDVLVPAQHGHRIDKAFDDKEVPHKLFVFPDAGHRLGGDENRITLIREAIGWFDEHLAQRM